MARKKRMILISNETLSTASNVTESGTIVIGAGFYGWHLKRLVLDHATAGTICAQLQIQAQSWGPSGPNGIALTDMKWLRAHTPNTSTTAGPLGTTLVWEGDFPLVGNGDAPEAFTVSGAVMNICGTTVPWVLMAWIEEPGDD